MDILLAHAYFLAEDPTEQRVMKPYVPLSILSLSAYLKMRGHTVGLFDATFRSLKEFEAEVSSTKPRMVGISVNMMTKFPAIKMIAIAKRHGAKVILGGPEVPFYAKEFLEEGADIVVIGEGERTLDETLRVLNGTEDKDALRSVDGLAFLDNGVVVQTPPRALLPTLDELSMPDRESIDLEPYLHTWKKRHGYSSLSIITMRGCPYTCKWCSHAVYGESYRRRSPSLVAEEILFLSKRYKPDFLWFADDVFTINHKWLFALEDELLRRSLSIPFECITRADRLTGEVVQTLKRMSCKRVWIGAESGSQRILDAMSRDVRIEQVEAITAACHEAGIEVGTFIMLGYAGEQPSDIEKTIAYLKRSRPDIVLTTTAYPIKGTTFYNEVSDRIVVPALPFSSWNDRYIRIAGRNSDRFYWFANRRVINEAAFARLRHARKKRWGKMMRTFMKAKAAHFGMKVFESVKF